MALWYALDSLWPLPERNSIRNRPTCYEELVLKRANACLSELNFHSAAATKPAGLVDFFRFPLLHVLGWIWVWFCGCGSLLRRDHCLCKRSNVARR